MLRDRAAELLAALAGQRALVLGDLIFDTFVYGDVNRVSREAPVPILSETRRNAMLGGAGNLARNLVSLGGQVRLVSVVGDDVEGEAAHALVEEACGKDAVLVRTLNRPTPSKIRYVSNNQQMFCVDRDPPQPIDEPTQAAILEAIKAQLGGADILILSDYGRGLLTPEVISGAISLARKAGLPVSVDPRGADFTRYDGATIIKPNAGELSTETGLPVTSDDEAEAALMAFKARLGKTEALLVTRGGGGMSLLDVDGRVSHHKSKPRSVFDVSGAGDTALAALSLAMAAGIPFVDAMALADLAAGVAVSKAGTAVVTPADIYADMRGDDAPPTWRIITREQASKIADDWRERGLKVGFTNGCFDLLHPGHLAVLRYAASVCDRLVVGLNTDASVKRLKGETRPINDEATRALMLASLHMVDRVVLFGEETPEALIEAIVPDVMIKGGDYVADDLPGADFVKANGGDVVLAPLVDGLSTTNLIKKMAGEA
ncbi:D-glycero-beta-D-manno-heptose 1-phosphate adenylyltransferase [Maricaulaceae bacterium EIL42A08]|nr:D-glycero-beta-D-manno-heptose 1-phosphate adenylyltransferase [Maricaulaceae bacterium EIL42A08]